MFEAEDEITLKELYRDYLSRELSDPKVQQAKGEFLAAFLAPAAPVFSVFSAAFWAPAAVLLVLLFALGQWQARYLEVEGPAVPIYRMFQPIIDEARAREAEMQAEIERKARLAQNAVLADDPLKNHMKPRVLVNRISSRVGPTMVYQKSYRENPVTIIWVFTGGQHP